MVILMKNEFKTKIIASILLVVLVLGSSVAFIRTAVANTPVPINQLFPDPVLAELIAINLGLSVGDAVVDAQLHDIFVLNLDPEERVYDFTGVELLINLEHLYADYQGLDHLEWFASLTNLRVVDIAGNDVEDLSPLNNNPYLADIRVAGNPIIDFGDFDDLVETYAQRLVILDGDASIDDLIALRELTHLRELMIFDMPLGTDELAVISSLIHLESLALMNMEIEGIDFVVNLTNLQELILAGNQSISNLMPLTNLVHLSYLEVTHNALSDISPLSAMNQLDFINLTGNFLIDLRPLSGLGATVVAEFQSVILPVVMVGEEQVFILYDVNGSTPNVTFADDNGIFADGIVIWTEEGNNELLWYSTSFSGSLQQGVWSFEPDWYDYYLCEEYCTEEDEEDDYWVVVEEDDESEYTEDDDLYDDFDYDYHHDNVNDGYVLDEDGNYVLSVVIVESICFVNCDAYLVEDESGSEPFGDVGNSGNGTGNDNGGDTNNDDDSNIDEDDEVIYDDIDDEFEFDFYIPDDFDFESSDIESDPYFVIEDDDSGSDNNNSSNNNAGGSGNGNGSDGSGGTSANNNNQTAGDGNTGIRLPQAGTTVVAVLGIGVILVGAGVALVVVKKKEE